MLDNKDITGKKPHEITRTGIARTFQNIRLFGQLSVLDNVKIACHLRSSETLLNTLLRSSQHYRDEYLMRDKCIDILSRFDLQDRLDEPANGLPYGDQRRLEIARAIATDPKVLLLDEPAAGMNPQEKVELRQLIRSLLTDFNLSILLIEHDMGVVMEICEHITVLDHGSIIATGSPSDIQQNEHVIEAYLGAPAHSVDDVLKNDQEHQP